MLKLGITVVGESDFSSPLMLVEVPGKDPLPLPLLKKSMC